MEINLICKTSKTMTKTTTTTAMSTRAMTTRATNHFVQQKYDDLDQCMQDYSVQNPSNQLERQNMWIQVEKRQHIVATAAVEANECLEDMLLLSSKPYLDQSWQTN